jgi:hypothetical protein
LDQELKGFVAFGPGFSGDYDTEDEARAVVKANGSGGVYRLLATNEAEFCEHGIDEWEYCPECNREYKRAAREAGYDEGTC